MNNSIPKKFRADDDENMFSYKKWVEFQLEELEKYKLKDDKEVDDE